VPALHHVVELQSELNWRVPETKPLWAGLQTVVSEFEEFAAEKTNRGREKKKRERMTMVG